MRTLLPILIFASGLFAQYVPPSGGGGNGHNVSAALACIAASGSGTTYTCSTTPTFVPAATDTINFCPDLANSGAATLVVNGQSGTPAINKSQGQAALIANDLRASPACAILTFDGTNWQMQGQIGNTPIAPAGSYSEYQYRSSGTAFAAATHSGPVPTASWTAHNFTSSKCWLNDFSAARIGLGCSFASALQFGLATQSLGSPPYTVIAQLDIQTTTEVGGLALYDGTKFYSIEILSGGDPATSTIETRQSGGLNAGGSVAGATVGVAGGLVTFKVVDDGTHRTWYYWSGGAFVQQLQETTATYLTPNAVGIIALQDLGATYGFGSVVLTYWCQSAATTCNGL